MKTRGQRTLDNSVREKAHSRSRNHLFRGGVDIAALDAIMDLPTFKDVDDASKTIHGIAHRTPILTSRTLDDELGVEVFIKAENFQRSGSFKFRGAYNAVSRCGKSGVLTYSSGNHAQGIALASKLLGVQATIIMPKDAPKSKVAGTLGYGASIVYYDRYSEVRDEVADRVMKTLPEETVFIPPYNHWYVIGGQGTVGKELIESLQSQKVMLDYLFVCVGGGGLISGISLAVKALSPTTTVIGVEPEAGDDAKRSLERGQIVHIDTPKTIADGAQTQHLGDMTFEIMKKNVSQIVTVSDQDLIDGMRFFGERMKMVVEPTGCLALAGLRKLVKSGHVRRGSKCGVIISGGNCDLSRFCDLISSSHP